MSMPPIVVSLTAESPEQVTQVIERARRAGAELVTGPGPQPWGYAGTFADPDGHLWMVTAAVRTS